MNLRNKRPRILTVIQARMGSSRLPGKVAKVIQGKTVLGHIIDRVLMSRLSEGCVVATSTRDEDKVIAKISGCHGVDVFFGSEHDVLNRYYQASLKYGAEAVVRVTADCPFVDIEMLDFVVDIYLSDPKLDYIVVEGLPKGLASELISLRALKEANQSAKKPYDREHVMPFITDHPKLFNNLFVPAPADLANPQVRLTLDTADDFDLISGIYQHLYKGAPIQGNRLVLDLIKKDRALSRMHRDVVKKYGT